MTPTPPPGSTPARYPDRRTAARPGTPSRPGAAAVSPRHRPYLTGRGTAPAIRRAREDHVTDADQTSDAASITGPPATTDVGDPQVPTRHHHGVLCTNRAGLAHLAGWKPGNSVNVRAGSDPDFPHPHGPKIGRELWYPFTGEHGVDAYLVVLAERAAAQKPRPVKPGNPDDLLAGADAADALHIVEATLRSYIRRSLPYWSGQKQGRPILPSPDVEEDRDDSTFGPYTHRAWYRSTLAGHQPDRPGRGRGAASGRPTGT
jgi:hypothetical protein